MSEDSKQQYQQILLRYEADVESIKIFAHTLNHFCLRFSNHHTKNSGDYEFMKHHEDKLRLEFVTKIKECIEKRVVKAFYKLAKGEKLDSEGE